MPIERIAQSAILDRESYPCSQKEGLGLWVALARCYNSFAQATDEHVKEFGLTSPQFGVLEALAHLGPLRMCDIGAKLLMSGANVTGVVDRLEKKGLVRRVVETDDRRTFHIHLTDEGAKFIAKIFPRLAEEIEKLGASLSSKERKTLTELLKKLGVSIQNQNQI